MIHLLCKAYHPPTTRRGRRGKVIRVCAYHDRVQKKVKIDQYLHSGLELIRRLELMPPRDARQAIRRVVSSAGFLQFIDGHNDGVFPVGVANSAIQGELHTQAKVIRLSSDDRNKQRGKGHEAGRRRYDLLQDMIDKGWIVKYRQDAVSLFKMDGKWFHAAVRTTKDRKELYLKSLRRSVPKQLIDALRQGEAVQVLGKGSAD